MPSLDFFLSAFYFWDFGLVELEVSRLDFPSYSLWSLENTLFNRTFCTLYSFVGLPWWLNFSSKWEPLSPSTLKP
jgi:hypothetical protein